MSVTKSAVALVWLIIVYAFKIKREDSEISNLLFTFIFFVCWLLPQVVKTALMKLRKMQYR